ncbi:MAG: polysaccharide deacetylase family protein [Rhodospirillaceae bacterium]
MPISNPTPHPRPRLAIAIDTEEAFNWDEPFSREHTCVSHMRYVPLLQDLFLGFGAKPTYLIDYPVAAQADGYGPLREFVQDGKADVGAHLHPWNTPPLAEDVNAFNSYAGNLPPDLERAKLQCLRDTIEDAFGRPPRVYRAGRYGLGPSSLATLGSLGFEVDTSPTPAFDLTGDGGPDYSDFPTAPFWADKRGGVLCVPYSGAFVGPLPRPVGAAIHRAVMRLPGSGLSIALLSLLKIVYRARLSPEGFTLGEMQGLTRQLLAAGNEIFVLSFHSPTIEPGNTPYAKTLAERDAFLGKIRDYIAFFVGECGGELTTLTEYRAELIARETLGTRLVCGVSDSRVKASWDMQRSCVAP